MHTALNRCYLPLLIARLIEFFVKIVLISIYLHAQPFGVLHFLEMNLVTSCYRWSIAAILLGRLANPTLQIIDKLKRLITVRGSETSRSHTASLLLHEQSILVTRSSLVIIFIYQLKVSHWTLVCKRYIIGYFLSSPAFFLPQIPKIKSFELIGRDSFLHVWLRSESQVITFIYYLTSNIIIRSISPFSSVKGRFHLIALTWIITIIKRKWSSMWLILFKLYCSR